MATRDRRVATAGASSSAAIEIKGLEKQFPLPGGVGEFRVLGDFDLTVPRGAFISLVGPSGCGKSTLLNIIVGTESKDAGQVIVHGHEDGRVRIGYVFQRPRLLNWLSVRENVAFALEAQETPRAEWDARITRYLAMVGLEGQDSNYPLNLSGGMQQRVGIARALAIEPDVLLMDEPFSNLDEITARRLRMDLLDIYAQSGTTILFVTHDLSEAAFLSDQIHMMNTNPGHIFRTIDIDLPRPRTYDDPRLFDLEKRIVTEFYAEIEHHR